MNMRIAIDFRSGCLKNFRLYALCKPKHVDRTMDTGLGRLHRIALVANRRGRTGEVIDLIHLDVERERHVVPHQFEMLVEMLDVLPGTGKKVVGAEDVAAFREKPLAKMRA